MRNIKFIVVHCTATQPSATVDSILNYWRTEMGWKSPGYHKIIKPSGEIIQLAPDEKICNGVAGFNSVSLHVSYIGGVDKAGKALDTRTPLQHKALRQVVANWKKQYPDAVVQGHRDFPNVHKECPSFDARKWWALVGLVLLFLITSCAGTKTTTKTEVAVEAKEKTAVKVKAKENRKIETVKYGGDTLKSQSFISAAGRNHPAPLLMESAGLKVGVYFKPNFDDRGLLLGYQVQTQATAKPTAKQTETIHSDTDTKVQQSTQLEATVTEKKKKTTRSRMTGFLIGAGLTLSFLLAFGLWWIKRKTKILF